jgi:sucrose-6-phosphate hydrolase SacC (GH32 family)
MIYHGQDSGRNQIAFALDDNLERWSRPVAIEPLTAAGERPEMRHWDPDCWFMDNAYYALSGGENPKLMKSADLRNWLYLGELFHPAFPAGLGVDKGEDVSCANMFRLGNKWMLLCISHGLGARYYLGDFIDEKYLPHPSCDDELGPMGLFCARVALDQRRAALMWGPGARPGSMTCSASDAPKLSTRTPEPGCLSTGHPGRCRAN